MTKNSFFTRGNLRKHTLIINLKLKSLLEDEINLKGLKQTSELEKSLCNTLFLRLAIKFKKIFDTRELT